MKTNPCPEYKSDIELYCCGLLSADRTTSLEEHLSGCEKCSRYYDALIQQDKQLTTWADSLDGRIQAGQDNLLQKLQKKEIPAAQAAQPFLFRYFWNAVAAGLLITAGFFAARLFQPAVNQEKLFAEWSQTIQPQMEQKLAAALAQQLRPELIQMRNDLADKMTAQINESTAQSVALSQAMNANLIHEFAEAIQTVQNRDRQLVSDAFSRMEEQRMQDKKQTHKAVTSLALATGEEIARTRRQLSEVNPVLFDPSNTNP